jgi:hypothetical protein
MRPIAHIYFLSGVYTLLEEVAELSGINTIAPSRPEDIFLAVKLYVILQMWAKVSRIRTGDKTPESMGCV